MFSRSYIHEVLNLILIISIIEKIIYFSQWSIDLIFCGCKIYPVASLNSESIYYLDYYILLLKIGEDNYKSDRSLSSVDFEFEICIISYLLTMSHGSLFFCKT